MEVKVEQQVRYLHILPPTVTLQDGSPGAIFQVVNNLTEHARSSGAIVSVGVREQNQLPVDYVACYAPNSHSRFANLLSRFLAGRSIVSDRIIMSDELLQADVVLVHNMPWLGQRLRTALPQKQIWLYVHNPIMRRVPSWSKRIAFGFFDGIINISEYMDQSFRKYFDAHQRLIVQNAYAGQVVSPYKDREIDVLFVGRMTPEKGVDVLLNALQRLDTSELRIVFIGSASNENDRPSRYSKNLNQRILDGQYESLGRMSRPETQLMVGQAKLLVVPSVWDEPFGLTLLEGFAGGACVVASAVGAIPAIVGNGGVLFPRSDAESLAQVIESLLSNQEERKMIAVVGQARLNHYSWAGSVEALTNRFG